jgi:hypothetical protein
MRQYLLSTLTVAIDWLSIPNAPKHLPLFQRALQGRHNNILNGLIDVMFEVHQTH